MASPQPYKLMIEALTESKAKFLKVIPTNSFVEREKYEISFKLKNLGEDDFPKGKLRIRIEWPSQQNVKLGIPVDHWLKKNELYQTKVVLTDVMSEGYALIYVDGYDAHVSPAEAHARNIQQDKLPNIEFYSDEEAKSRILESSFSSIKCKTPEKIYEFWALIIATISLAIIALEKFFAFLANILARLMAAAT